MSTAGFLSDPDQFVPNQAQGYYPSDEGEIRRLFAPTNVHGGGAMLASVDDLVRWLRNIETLEVGDADLFQAFFAPGRLDDGRLLRYAAGWELDRHRGLHVLRHGGIAAGFQTHIAWFPEPQLGVVVLGNLHPCWPWPLANRVAEVCATDRSATGHTVSPTPPPERDRQSSHRDLAGRYFADTGLPVSISVGDVGLELEAGIFLRRALRESRADVFVREADGGETYTFHRDVAGRVTHFTMENSDGACPRYHSSLDGATRFENVTLSDRELARFEGRYLSDELQTIYTLVPSGDGLAARHLRCHDWSLRAIQPNTADTFEDQFAAEGHWPGIVTFEGESGGDPAGFRVRNSQVNVFFRRLS